MTRIAGKRQTLFERQRGKCFWCGQSMFFPKRRKQRYYPQVVTVDHIVPKSKGGSNRIENLVAACKKCNEARGNSDADLSRARLLACESSDDPAHLRPVA